MVDLYCASYSTPPDAVTLDIDDAVDAVHGHRQLSLFNGHYDERCFLPIHVSCASARHPPATRSPVTSAASSVASAARAVVASPIVFASTTRQCAPIAVGSSPAQKCRIAV